MQIIADSSTLISLARSGLLSLARRLPVELILLDVVWAEVVEAGRAGGHPDAAAVDAQLGHRERAVAPMAPSVDAAVLAASVTVGAMVANDLALGRRARNLGVQWLRTADLVLLAAQAGTLPTPEACDAIAALRSSGRITDELATAYLEELT